MKTYIGTKVIGAKPMNRGEYNVYRGWSMPKDEDAADEGYLVEYTDGGKGNDQRHTGYISWSPKKPFDDAYRETSGLTFGLALEALKIGAKVARAGWNGKGMWLSLSGPMEGRSISHDKFWSGNNADFAYNQPLSKANVLPCITMKTADNSILMGWLASQTDMLATDWSIVS